MKHTVVKASDVASHPTHRMDAEYWIEQEALRSELNTRNTPTTEGEPTE